MNNCYKLVLTNPDFESSVIQKDNRPDALVFSLLYDLTNKNKYCSDNIYKLQIFKLEEGKLASKESVLINMQLTYTSLKELLKILHTIFRDERLLK